MLDDPWLAPTDFVDFDTPTVRALARSLLPSRDYVRAAFEFVRDEIPHTATTTRQVVTARASDVLAERTGICHAKANLLVALLRLHDIPAGFGFQHLTLDDNDLSGYCLHAFAIADINNHLVGLDPRASTEYSPNRTCLAFANRPEFDEYVLCGRWANPDAGTMLVLTTSASLDDALRRLPDTPSTPPDDPDFDITQEML